MDLKTVILHSLNPLRLQHICLDSLLRGTLAHPELVGQLYNVEIQEDMLSHLLSRKLVLPLPALPNEFIARKCCLAVAYLVNRNTKKLDFSNWGTQFWEGNGSLSTHFSLILSAASAKARDLELVKLHSCVRIVDSDDDHDSDSDTEEEIEDEPGAVRIPRDCFRYLLTLRSLQHLHVAGLWKWTNKNFLDMCEHLTNLVTLKISLSKDFDDGGLENIYKLKYLEEFCFLSPGDAIYRDVYNSLHYHCARYGFGSYRVIGCKVEDCFDSHHKFCMPIVSSFCPSIPFIMGGDNCIEDLQSTFCLPNDELPNLKHLLLYGPSIAQQILEKVISYKNLVYLALVKMDSVPCYILMKVAGRRLSRLFVDFSNVDLYKVLHLCPNLTELVCDSSKVAVRSKYKVRVNSLHFRLLKRLHVRFGGAAPEDFVSMALNAPELEELSFRKLHLSGSDCRAVQTPTEGSLTKLKKFRLELLSLRPNCSLLDVEVLVKKVVALSSQLVDIQVDWENAANGRIWAKECPGALASIELIKQKSSFQSKAEKICYPTRI